ncbi:helix-turn-helix domain-containing protein [Pontibaca methylaminivorans]|uniref:helix-turn-helix domain-containing protein n=1 Tax=Pontibaca methylaminivorans TaxID=515897 RepID=UPI002FDB317E
MVKTAQSPVQLRSVFGNNLRTLIRARGSISELARELGLNRTQMNRFLNGESFPRPDVLHRICTTFGVDARVLLEPLDHGQRREPVLNGPVLCDFIGPSLGDVDEETFPSGLYRFSRQHPARSDQFLIGLVLVFRSAGTCYLRGYEPREALREQGLRPMGPAREFRGLVMRQEDGIAALVSRRNGMTTSFIHLARVASFENNFWLGYTARPTRESPAELRTTRLVYEHLGRNRTAVMQAARTAGYVTRAALLPFHRHLLQIDRPFR